MTLETETEVPQLLLVLLVTALALCITRYIGSQAKSLGCSSKPTLEQERDARQRAAMAAASRQQQSLIVERTQTRITSKSKRPTHTNSIIKDEISEHKILEQKEPEQQPTTSQGNDVSIEQIRQGTVEDRVRWEEDRNSQFGGFNIYGHKTSGCEECGGHQLDQADVIPSFSSGGTIHNIASVPHLPMADEAERILQNLATEFEPVLQARGWTVLTLTEMCCCGDGDETLGKQTSNNGHARSNILGYCVSTGDGRTAAGIHIRLRPSCRNGSHFYPYRETVATMAHELAHIAEPNHSAKFYQLMSDIERQRLEYLGRGVVLDDSGFPLGDMGHRLNPRNHEVIGSRELKRKVFESAQQRREGSEVVVAAKAPPVAVTRKPTRKRAPKPSRVESYKRRNQLRAVEKRLGIADHKTE